MRNNNNKKNDTNNHGNTTNNKNLNNNYHTNSNYNELRLFTSVCVDGCVCKLEKPVSPNKWMQGPTMVMIAMMIMMMNGR